MTITSSDCSELSNSLFSNEFVIHFNAFDYEIGALPSRLVLIILNNDSLHQDYVGGPNTSVHIILSNYLF